MTGMASKTNLRAAIRCLDEELRSFGYECGFIEHVCRRVGRGAMLRMATPDPEHYSANSKTTATDERDMRMARAFEERVYAQHVSIINACLDVFRNGHLADNIDNALIYRLGAYEWDLGNG